MSEDDEPSAGDRPETLDDSQPHPAPASLAPKSRESSGGYLRGPARGFVLALVAGLIFWFMIFYLCARLL